MLKKVLIVVGILGVILVLRIVMQPDTYTVQRSIRIAAPPAVVFSHVNDFHKWENWSPWAKLDPNMKTTYEGPTEGKGASYHWIGDNRVGEGRMTILESSPLTNLRIKLEFIKPIESLCDTVFTFTPEGAQTAVQWSMSGPNGFLTKVMQVFKSMDSAVGPDFERGLESLKKVSESTPAAPPSTTPAVAPAK